MRDTVFGNNIVNIHARSGDRCAIIQICNDSGNGSLCRGRRERKNRASSFGERGTANEVHLTANTRNLLGAILTDCDYKNVKELNYKQF